MNNEKYQESPVMEKGILSEENLPQVPPQQQNMPKRGPVINPSVKISAILSKLKNFKKPKLLTIIILLVLIIVTLLGLLLLSSRQPPKQDLTRVKITVNEPQASTDPELENSKKAISNFKGELDTLDSELNNIKFPQIDLEVNFD